MDELDSLLADAFFRVVERLKADPKELAKRLKRRRGAVMGRVVRARRRGQGQGVRGQKASGQREEMGGWVDGRRGVLDVGGATKGSGGREVVRR